MSRLYCETNHLISISFIQTGNAFYRASLSFNIHREAPLLMISVIDKLMRSVGTKKTDFSEKRVWYLFDTAQAATLWMTSLLLTELFCYKTSSTNCTVRNYFPWISWGIHSMESVSNKICGDTTYGRLDIDKRPSYCEFMPGTHKRFCIEGGSFCLL
jgi:hypothetical protein